MSEAYYAAMATVGLLAFVAGLWIGDTLTERALRALRRARRKRRVRMAV